MNYSPRKLMELMQTKNFERTYLGEPNEVILKQTLFSLVNSFKPQTMTKDETKDFIYKLVSLYEQMKNRNCTALVEDVETILKHNVLSEFKSNHNLKSALDDIIFHDEWEDCECHEND